MPMSQEEQQRMDALEEAVRNVTDRVGAVMDQVNRVGVAGKTRFVFRCGVSGLYYPSNYIKEWGRLYGIGLGPDVCSESLQSDYDTDLPAITPQLHSIEQIMHPVYVSKAQLDWDLVPEAEAIANAPVLERDDPLMTRRGLILRDKQKQNPRGSRTLTMLEVQWEKMKGRR